MSKDSCPKTCSLLSVATILISVGIVQLLAGIILLKSEDVYLLAGTDFVVAVSNVLVGSLLGIAASMWEKKKKVASLKNTARQNVLAGLYIAALSMNATGAIIMILGDGNKLLTSKDNANISGDFIYEIMACAYVTSVCSPIVCLVIALVCLSGNRIQIYDNMKKKDSITKAESYGWVFENNYDGQSTNLLRDSSNRNASVSDDNVFLEKLSLDEKLFKIKPSKKTKSRDSVTSVSELKTPLEIWTHKRNKILKEITSPKSIFFADDYLQFPDCKYDSYIGTMIPRITETSFIRPNNRSSTQTNSKEHKMEKIEKTMSCKPYKPHMDELNLKLASRRMSYPDSVYLIGKTDSYEEDLGVSPRTAFDDIRQLIDEPDAQTHHLTHSKLQRTYAASVDPIKRKQQRQTVCFDFEASDSSQSPSESCDLVGNQSNLDWLQDPHRARRNSNGSGSSGLTAETISELKAKINKMSFNKDENHEQNREFLTSFKQDCKRKSHLSESDVEDKQSVFQKLHKQYSVFSQNSESDSEISLAGEIIPISIRPTAINRANSIPLKTICSQVPNRYSVNIKNNPSDQRLDTNSDNIDLSLTNDDFQSSQRTYHFSSSSKEKSANKSDTDSNISARHSEKKFDFKQRMSFMGSIEESPTEEFIQDENLLKSRKKDGELDNPSPKASNERDLPKNGLRRARNSFSLKRLSSKAAPNLLNRLWSMKRAETKTDLTSLIMDSDSLVGLSDEELMARTRRLRQLRKSVELRSKLEKHDDVV